MTYIIDNTHELVELSDYEIRLATIIERYLDKSYQIKKCKKAYIFQYNSIKHIIDENTLCQTNIKSTELNKNKYIMNFLLKSLRNKWSIKKNQNNYILTKKHNGKKTYSSPNFLTYFIKNSF